MIGQRVLPHRNFEPLQMTQRLLVVRLVVTGMSVFWLMPMFLMMSCNHALGEDS